MSTLTRRLCHIWTLSRKCGNMSEAARLCDVVELRVADKSLVLGKGQCETESEVMETTDSCQLSLEKYLIDHPSLLWATFKLDLFNL
ncbi:hypothetical protein J6590_016974 [Homalodisca vitripennis]|nr:hypothetical protein J6590_016974 [Homalodisca vitripennis]